MAVCCYGGKGLAVSYDGSKANKDVIPGFAQLHKDVIPGFAQQMPGIQSAWNGGSGCQTCLRQSGMTAVKGWQSGMPAKCLTTVQFDVRNLQDPGTQKSGLSVVGPVCHVGFQQFCRQVKSCI